MGIPSILAAPIAWAPSGQEWLILALLLVVLFGAKKIPELARGLGTGMKEFKKAVREAAEDEEEGKPDQEGGKKDPTSRGGNGAS